MPGKGLRPPGKRSRLLIRSYNRKVPKKERKNLRVGRRGVFPKYGMMVRQYFVERGLKPEDIYRQLKEITGNAPDLPSLSTIERWITQNKWDDDRVFHITSAQQIEKEFQQLASDWIKDARELRQKDPQAFVNLSMGDQMAKIAASLKLIRRQQDKRRSFVECMDDLVPFIKSTNPPKDKIVWFDEILMLYQDELCAA